MDNAHKWQLVSIKSGLKLTLPLLGSVAKGTWVPWTHISTSPIPIPSHLTVAIDQAERKRPSGTELTTLLTTLSESLETLLGQWKHGHWWQATALSHYSIVLPSGPTSHLFLLLLQQLQPAMAHSIMNISLNMFPCQDHLQQFKAL